jgi:hypothetical protein
MRRHFDFAKDAGVPKNLALNGCMGTKTFSPEIVMRLKPIPEIHLADATAVFRDFAPAMWLVISPADGCDNEPWQLCTMRDEVGRENPWSRRSFPCCWVLEFPASSGREYWPSLLILRSKKGLPTKFKFAGNREFCRDLAAFCRLAPCLVGQRTPLRIPRPG